MLLTFRCSLTFYPVKLFCIQPELSLNPLTGHNDNFQFTFLNVCQKGFSQWSLSTIVNYCQLLPVNYCASKSEHKSNQPLIVVGVFENPLRDDILVCCNENLKSSFKPDVLVCFASSVTGRGDGDTFCITCVDNCPPHSHSLLVSIPSN